jgi:hypothetical protein
LDLLQEAAQLTLTFPAIAAAMRHLICTGDHYRKEDINF